MFLILSIITGFTVALMIQLNGILQEAAGGPGALTSIHICGLTAILLLTLLLKILPGNISRLGRPEEPERQKEKAPWYFLSAGMIGTAIVFLASVSFIKGGILLSLSGSLTGQTAAASLAEGFYSGEREKSPLLQRVLAPALLLPGSLLIGFKEGVSIPWIVLSWTPGILLMLQQSMNSRNTLRWGTPLTVIFNYVSALVLILPLTIITFGGPAGAFNEITLSLSPLPWYIIAGGGVIGVFTTGAIAFFLLKAPALLVILGIYAGELTGGIILDLYNGNPVAAEKIIGVLLIAAGLASGKLKFRRKVPSVI